MEIYDDKEYLFEITNMEFPCAQHAAQDLIFFHTHDIASTQGANRNLTIAVAPLKI